MSNRTKRSLNYDEHDDVDQRGVNARNIGGDDDADDEELANALFGLSRSSLNANEASGGSSEHKRNRADQRRLSAPPRGCVLLGDLDSRDLFSYIGAFKHATVSRPSQTKQTQSAAAARRVRCGECTEPTSKYTQCTVCDILYW